MTILMVLMDDGIDGGVAIDGYIGITCPTDPALRDTRVRSNNFFLSIYLFQ